MECEIETLVWHLSIKNYKSQIYISRETPNFCERAVCRFDFLAKYFWFF